MSEGHPIISITPPSSDHHYQHSEEHFSPSFPSAEHDPRPTLLSAFRPFSDRRHSSGAELVATMEKFNTSRSHGESTNSPLLNSFTKFNFLNKSTQNLSSSKEKHSDELSTSGFPQLFNEKRFKGSISMTILNKFSIPSTESK